MALPWQKNSNQESTPLLRLQKRTVKLPLLHIRSWVLSLVDITRRGPNIFLQNNCLHEIFFDQAFQRAGFLDEYMEKHGKTLGPLHGLPVSLKDQFHVKGNDTTMGYIG